MVVFLQYNISIGKRAWFSHSHFVIEKEEEVYARISNTKYIPVSRMIRIRQTLFGRPIMERGINKARN